MGDSGSTGWRARTSLRLFDLGLDPERTSSEDLRRTRILSVASCAIAAVGLVSAVQYAAIDLPFVALALLLAVTAAGANLALVWRTRRIEACTHVALGILTLSVLATNLVSGGFYDANFAWFYLIPMAAAVALGLRGAIAWNALTVCITIALWSAPQLGLVIDNHIPPESRAFHSLFDRLTALIGIGLIGWSFVVGQRRAEQELGHANHELLQETAYVGLLRHAAVTANRAVSFDAALEEGIGHICRAMGWPLGSVWRVAPEGHLELSPIHYSERPDAARVLGRALREVRMERGEGPPGQALAEGRTVSAHRVGESDDPLSEAAREAGVRTTHAVPVPVGGEVVAVLQFATDRDESPDERLASVLGDVGVQFGRVAERRSLEERIQRSQRLEAVGQLAAGIAHEINNPMSFVRANLNLVRGEWKHLRSAFEKDRDPQIGERLADVEEALAETGEGVDRVVSIVQDMRRLSEGGEVVQARVDLGEVVERAVRIAGSRARSQVELILEPGTTPAVRGSAGLLTQVFVNGLLNAFYAVEDAGTVRVSTGTGPRGAWVRIDDDGPGLPDGVAQRLFDPFFTTKPAGEGTGLGLYVSYQIVRSHSGELTVAAAERGGTRFEVWLPVDPEQERE
jgi:signal transduction histidine kinase